MLASRTAISEVSKSMSPVTVTVNPPSAVVVVGPAEPSTPPTPSIFWSVAEIVTVWDKAEPVAKYDGINDSQTHCKMKILR